MVTIFIKDAARNSSHCVKSVQIRSFFWSVFCCILTEYRKIRTRKNSVFGHFSCSVCLESMLAEAFTLPKLIPNVIKANFFYKFWCFVEFRSDWVSRYLPSKSFWIKTMLFGRQVIIKHKSAAWIPSCKYLIVHQLPLCPLINLFTIILKFNYSILQLI